MRRVIFAIGVMLLLSAACCAQQFPPAKPTPVQHLPGIPLIDHTPTPMPSFEGLVAFVAQQIVQKHLKSLVVIGVAGPKTDEPTRLGLDLGDKFSVALAKQSKEFQVGERGALREFVKKAGVADAMVVSDSLANWIASKVAADGYVLLKFLNVWENRADVEAILYETDKEDGKFLEAGNTPVDLSSDQYSNGLRPFDSEWNKETHPGRDGDALPSDSMPTCGVCHSLEMTEIAHKAGHVDDGKSTFKETGVYFVTVLPDGKTNEIAVIKSANYGLNGSAVDAILKWEFKPATDALGKSVSFRVKVEFAWQLY